LVIKTNSPAVAAVAAIAVAASAARTGIPAETVATVATTAPEPSAPRLTGLAGQTVTGLTVAVTGLASAGLTRVTWHDRNAVGATRIAPQ